MLDNQATIDACEDLMKLNIDAAQAYEQAIANIDVPDVKSQIQSFKADHDRHVSELRDCIVQLGGKAPSSSPDLKGYFIEGMTKLRAAMGTEQALKAMKMNEELTNSRYDKALKLDVSPHVHALFQKNRDDERRHLDYINECIQAEVWAEAEDEAPRRTA